jgi:hypothetical protein
MLPLAWLQSIMNRSGQLSLVQHSRHSSVIKPPHVPSTGLSDGHAQVPLAWHSRPPVQAGVQAALLPQTPGVPPPPHVCGAAHTPQDSPQPLAPQFLPPHFGVQGMMAGGELVFFFLFFDFFFSAPKRGLFSRSAYCLGALPLPRRRRRLASASKSGANGEKRAATRPTNALRREAAVVSERASLSK